MVITFNIVQGVPKKGIKKNINISEMGRAFDKIFLT